MVVNILLFTFYFIFAIFFLFILILIYISFFHFSLCMYLFFLTKRPIIHASLIHSFLITISNNFQIHNSSFLDLFKINHLSQSIYN